MSTVDPSPTDLPAISYIRVASVDPNDAARAVERQRAQIALAARHLGLRLVDEFVDIGYSGMSMDRPGLRRLLDHVATHEVGYCIVATLDQFSLRPEDAADIDQALSDALVAIVVATDHTGPTPH
jgi:site-specific DNA recombinase